MNIGDLFIGLLVDPKGDLKAQVTKAAGEAGEAGGQSMGDKLKASLTKAMVGVGAAAGAGLAASVQEFVKFDDQMRTVYTLLPDISEEAMDEMEGQVKSLAVEMGRLPEDIIPGLYDALSSGIPQDNVFAFMESASKAAVAGGANTQEVVKVLSATINAFGLDAADTEKLTDSFFNAINKGVTTFPELSAAMSGVTPTAAAMGLSIDDVLAAITAMTLQGTPTAQAVTGINASLVALQRTTPAMEQALKNLGYETGQAALDALGYQGTMEALRAEADKMGVPLIELTGRMEGSAAMLQLTGENAETATGLLDSFGDTAGMTTTAFETMEGGVGGAARRLAAQIRVTMIDIGEQFQALGPLFTAFGPTMGRLLGAGMGAAAGLITRGFVALMTKLIPSLIPSSVITGTATGAAQGQAHAASATGPQVVKALFTRIGAMAIPLAPAGTTVGVAVGSAMALGIAVGIVLIGTHVIAEAVNNATNAARIKIRDNPNSITTADLFQSRAPAWAVKKLEVAQEMQNLGTEALAAFNAEWDKGLGEGLMASDPALLERAKQAGLVIGGTVGAAVGPALATAADASIAPAMAQYADALRQHGIGTIPPAMADVAAASAHAFGSTMTTEGRLEMERVRNNYALWAGLAARAAHNAMADELNAGIPSIRDQWKAYVQAEKDAIDPMKQIAWLEARLAGDKLAEGLASKDPLTRRRAELMRDGMVDQLDDLKGLLGIIGEDAGDTLGSKAVAALRAWQSAWFKTLHGMAQTAATLLKTHSPAKAGPWSKDGGPGAWMYRLGRSLPEELQRGIDRGGMVSPPLFRGLTPGFGLPPLGNIDGTQTFRHEIDLTSDAAEALRSAGYDDERVGAALGRFIDGAWQGRHVTFSTTG